MNDDPVLPSLRIPTGIVPEDGSGLPPVQYDLDEAERSVVVLLADGHFVLRPAALPKGRLSWPEFAAQLSVACRSGRHRFLPFQLSKAAWGSHPVLDGLSFAWAYTVPVAQRTAWVNRRVIVELLRFLRGMDNGENAPLRVFISYAKADIDRKPRVFRAFED